MPVIRPLQNIFDATTAHGFAIPIIDPATILAAPAPLNIYFSGDRDTFAQESATYFSAPERRYIGQRVYENAYANQPISLPDNLHPGIRNAATQGLFRYNPHILLNNDHAFHRFWHTEPKFLYSLLNERISPRGGIFLHDILAISKYLMCELCSRFLLICLLNDGEMGKINQADHDGHFNIIIIANDLIGLTEALGGGVRRVKNTILNNNILSQASVVLENIGNLRTRLEIGIAFHLYTGSNNWFMVLSN